MLHSWSEGLLFLPWLTLILLEVLLLLAILGHKVIVYASVNLRILRDINIIYHLLSLNIVKNSYWLLVLVEYICNVFHVLLWGS
jgi:hypothetical protein